jgi:valyl-tRNA synthetase
VLLQNGGPEDLQRLEVHRHYLDTLARLESITWLSKDQAAPESATALVGDMKVLIPMAGLIDKEAELLRLRKELDKLAKDLEKSEKKLANQNFLDRAPPEVVAKEQGRVAEQRSAMAKLEEQLRKISAL